MVRHLWREGVRGGSSPGAASDLVVGYGAPQGAFEPGGCEGPLPSASRSRLNEAEGGLTRGTSVKVDAALTTTGHGSTVRWRGSGKQDGKVYASNQRRKTPPATERAVHVQRSLQENRSVAKMGLGRPRGHPSEVRRRRRCARPNARGYAPTANWSSRPTRPGTQALPPGSSGGLLSIQRHQGATGALRFVKPMDLMPVSWLVTSSSGRHPWLM